MQLGHTSRVLHGCAALILGLAIAGCSAGANQRTMPAAGSTPTALTASSEVLAPGAADGSRRIPS